MVWRRKHRVASLHLIVAEAKAHVHFGVEHARALFFIISIFRCERTHRGGSNARWTCVFFFSFFVCGTFLLSKELWEPKEELRVQSIVVKNCQKNSKGVFLLEVHYRVGFEIWDLSLNHKGHVSAVKSRQIFNLSSGTPWIWNPSFFCAFFGLCTSVCAHTCSLSFWHDQAHSSFYSCLPHFFLSLSPCGLPRFVLFFSFRYGVPASLCAMLPYTHTGWQNGLGLRQRMWPGGSPRGIGSSSWVMRKKMRCCHMVPRRSNSLISNSWYDCWFLFVPSPSLFFALSGYLRDRTWMKYM